MNEPDASSSDTPAVSRLETVLATGLCAAIAAGGLAMAVADGDREAELRGLFDSLNIEIPALVQQQLSLSFGAFACIAGALAAVLIALTGFLAPRAAALWTRRLGLLGALTTAALACAAGFTTYRTALQKGEDAARAQIEALRAKSASRPLVEAIVAGVERGLRERVFVFRDARGEERRGFVLEAPGVQASEGFPDRPELADIANSQSAVVLPSSGADRSITGRTSTFTNVSMDDLGSEKAGGWVYALSIRCKPLDRGEAGVGQGPVKLSDTLFAFTLTLYRSADGFTLDGLPAGEARPYATYTFDRALQGRSE